jgi:hypothetical protein
LICTKKIAALIGFFCFSLVGPAVFAQTRMTVRIFVAPMESGTAEEQEYFMTNMKMEFTGAAYEVVETREDSDYNVVLSISRQEVEAESGTGMEILNTVSLGLFVTETGRELITLSWDYNEVSDMNMWNLFLITQAMANAPISKIPAGAMLAPPVPPPPPPPPPEEKVYVNPLNKLLWCGPEISQGYAFLGEGPRVSGALAFEYDFLPFMGVGTGFGYQVLFPLYFDTYSYWHIMEYNFFVPVQLKFLFAVENYLIIPHVGAELGFGNLGMTANLNAGGGMKFNPTVTGGVNFRLPMGPGAFDIGCIGMYNLGINIWGAEFTIGYKFGFLPRAKKNKPSPPEAPPETPPEALP